MKLSLIIPCYNEEEGIENLHSKLVSVLTELSSKWEVELIFIDDGSTDGTNELLEKFFGQRDNTSIIRHEKNKNLGAALRTGFAHATGDIIICLDSDCTYDPKDIFPMLELFDEDTSIVTASPYHPQGKVEGVPPYRVFLGKSVSFLYSLVTGRKIYTYTPMFRAYRREALNNIAFEANDFIACAEIVVRALYKGYKVKEFPNTLHVRKFGLSKMSFINVTKSHLKFLVKAMGLRFKR